MKSPRKFASVMAPLHGKGSALEKMAFWMEMAAMNPKGFRDISTKKNRQRGKNDDPKKVGLNGRFLTRPEQLQLEAGIA